MSKDVSTGEGSPDSKEGNVSAQSNGDSQEAKDTNSDKELVNLQKALQEMTEKSQENYDSYVRALAEAENTRKRYVKERNDAIKYSLESFFRDFLPILDSFDKAFEDIDRIKQQNDSFVSGVTLVKKLTFEVLERHGVLKVEALGEKFDPKVHQAIRKVESSEVKEETVKEEYSKGYLLHDRLLRPAMVSVEVPTSDT